MSEFAPTGPGRLFRGESAVDFHGRRRVGLIVSIVLLVLTIGSLTTRGLDLGIEFVGGVSWDIPAADVSIAEAETVLSDNGVDPAGARIQRRASDSGEFLRVQAEVQSDDILVAIQLAFADAAGVERDDVSVSSVSASWGEEVTGKAVRALIVFLLAAMVFISIRFEWRMAVAAIVGTVHDVVIAVGIYSLLGFVVTPATVIAFLTILGYSLYDTIVIFDRMRENEARFEGREPPYADVVNTSMNQVLMRTLFMCASSMIPVLSILIVGSGILGATALSEFAIALLVGMITGTYSSIFVSAPLLGVLKASGERWHPDESVRAKGDALRRLVIGGTMPSRRSRSSAEARVPATAGVGSGGSGAPSSGASAGGPGSSGRTGSRARPGAGPEELLSHPPRPRKKKRR